MAHGDTTRVENVKIVMLKGEKGNTGYPTEEQVAEALAEMGDTLVNPWMDTNADVPIDNWLDEHPEATTTVQDNSLTYKKFVNGTLDYVIPEMYGAVGDGTTDDTGAFTNMLNAENCILLTPNKSYYIANDLPVLDNVFINLNGAEIKVHSSIKAQDNVILFNGIIQSWSNTRFSSPTIALLGKHNKVDSIQFKSNALGANYIFTRKDSNMSVISNCHFDGNAKIGINVGGSNAVIENCYFEDVLDNTLYSNCIKMSADDSGDLTTPCSRNTRVYNCYFGFQGDNCIDTFSGADGAIIDSCTFNNGAQVAIEIKNSFKDIDEADARTTGFSIPDLRTNRNITVSNCIFLGTGYITVVTTGISASYSGTPQYVKNVTFKDCIAKNLNGIPWAISQETENITFDNIMCPAISTYKTLAVYGTNCVIKNIDNPYLIINIHGDYLIQNCKVWQIGIVNSTSNRVEIVGCTSYVTGTYFITFNFGNEVIIRDCIALTGTYLVALNGAPTRMVVKNNIVNILMNNGYGSAGGKVYLVNNLYANYVAPATTGIVVNEGNYKLT